MRVLLVEDDKDLCKALCSVLENAGLTLDVCNDGEEGLALLLEGYYGACILDRMLPCMDGLTLLRNARAKGITAPVLMLTALGRIDDRVDGLEAGADDYLTKPFDTRELIARVKALLRRPAVPQEQASLSFGDIVLNTEQMTLSGPKTEVTLSKRECGLLEALCSGAGRTLSRNMLLGRVWGAMTEIEETNLDTYIYFVRRRLSTVGSNAVISTVRGVGYRLEERNG